MSGGDRGDRDIPGLEWAKVAPSTIVVATADRAWIHRPGSVGDFTFLRPMQGPGSPATTRRLLDAAVGAAQRAVQEAQSAHLDAGSTRAAPPMTLLGWVWRLAGYYTTVYSYERNDPDDRWKVYDVDAPAWVDDLDELVFGQGYWINVTQDVTLLLRGGSRATPSAAGDRATEGGANTCASCSSTRTFRASSVTSPPRSPRRATRCARWPPHPVTRCRASRSTIPCRFPSWICDAIWCVRPSRIRFATAGVTWRIS